MIFKGGGDASGGGSGGNVNLVEVGGATLGSADVVDQGNQALRVNIVAGGGAGGTSSNFGSSFPSAGTAAGVQNPSGKMAAMNVDGSGNLLVNVAVGGGGGGSSTGSTTAYQGNPPWSIVGSGGLFPVTGSVQINGSATVYQGTPPWAVVGSGGQVAVVGSGGQITVLQGSSPVAVAGTVTVLQGSSPVSVTGSAGLFPVTGSGGLIGANVSQLGGTALSGANVVDTVNTALRVNIVAGGGSGGTSSNFGSSFPSAGTAVGAQNPTGKMAALNVDGSGNLLVNVQVGGGASSGSTTAYQGSAPWSVVGSGGLFPISGSATVYQGSSQWVVTGSGGLFPVTGSGGVVGIVGSTSSGALSVVGSGGVFPITGSGGIIGIIGSTASGALSVVGSGGTIAVTQGTSPWAVAGSGGVFGILGSTSSGALSVVGSGGTFPITGSGGAIGIIGSTASGALSVIGSGGLINVTQVPIVSGSGHFCNSLISLNTTNGSCVKSSPSSLYGWAIVNTNASIRYVKLYSKGTTISVGTDTPIVTLPIPGNANGAGMLAAEYNAGITFGSGLGYAVTVNAPAADSTAVGSGDIVMNLFYN